MEVAIISNAVAGGWHPLDLQRFLGGNEESLALLSEAMQEAGFAVEVFTSLRGPDWVSPAGVIWRQREAFDDRYPVDALISWKDRAIWLHPQAAKLRIHASQDVEPPLSNGAMRQIDRFITLASYHTERLTWIDPAKRTVIPLGVDPEEYKPEGEKESLAIYATSPDRGLETLLTDWPRIRETHPDLRLLITYDWSRLATMSGPQGAAYAKHLEKLAAQPGIERATYDAAGIKAAFQRARFYIHPLIHPDADLFGFGAMKAQACGCKLVLSGLDCGFRDMAREWIPYDEFVNGRMEPEKNPRFSLEPMPWDRILSEYWAPLLRGEVQHAS